VPMVEVVGWDRSSSSWVKLLATGDGLMRQMAGKITCPRYYKRVRGTGTEHCRRGGQGSSENASCLLSSDRKHRSCRRRDVRSRTHARARACAASGVLGAMSRGVVVRTPFLKEKNYIHCTILLLICGIVYIILNLNI
jgi:hypothetical protein